MQDETNIVKGKQQARVRVRVSVVYSSGMGILNMTSELKKEMTFDSCNSHHRHHYNHHHHHHHHHHHPHRHHQQQQLDHHQRQRQEY